MALTTELITVLENTEEPLQKRLRIANNAFNSNDLLALNKESIILGWMSKTGASEDCNDVWKVLNSCLSKERIRTLRPNDIKADVLASIIRSITSRLKNELNVELKHEILQCAIIILKNEIFQNYFKHDTKRFSKFIATVLLNIDDVNGLNEILTIYMALITQLIVEPKYSEYFLLFVFNALIDILIKFEDDILFENCQKLIQSVLFPLNSNGFNKFINHVIEKKYTPDILSNNIIKILNNIYTNDKQRACLVFKLIFITFIKSCGKANVYHFFVLIVQIVGFTVVNKLNLNLPIVEKVYSLKTSLNILAEILEIISTYNTSISSSIYKVSFSKFLKYLLISILRIHPKPSLSILKIIKCLIIIDPVIITSSISEIIVFLINEKNEDIHNYYSEVMISIFEMYFKLHRLHKFCSELLRTIQDVLSCSTTEIINPKLQFADKKMIEIPDYITSARELFPENVLKYFQECITLQSNKQIISIMRTFITNLNEISNNLNAYMEGSKILYIQIVSDLTCQFLLAVRIAEHTTTELTIEKFFKDLDDLKEFLKKFGTALLEMEHNQILMFSFLNICYTWGENAILLNYYAPINTAMLQEHSATDNSANNLTYLHSYLSTDQWSLVSQRIKNFGEEPCKRILQKLIIQKFRAMMLFEPEINETMESSIISSYSSNLETCWDIIFTERFMTSKFFIKMESSQLISLANLLIVDILNKNNFKLLMNKSIIDSRDLVQSILYASLLEINSLFKKKKRKHDEKTIKPLNTRILKNVDLDIFIRNETIDIKTLEELFNDELEGINSFEIDYERFSNLMEIIKHIPVCSLSQEVQTTLFLFLLSICVDLKHCKTERNTLVVQLCETYLIGLVENTTSPNIFDNKEHSPILMKTIIEYTEQYKNILNFCINKTLKQNDLIPGFKSCLNLLFKHISGDKYLDVSIITLHGINKAVKYKLTEENKECLRKYKLKLCEHLYNIVQDSIRIEAYVLICQKYFLKNTNDEEKLEKLISISPKFIDYSLNNINENNTNECLLLFELILTNKSTFKDIPTDFILSVWKLCKDLKINEDYATNYNKTLTLLFERISIEQFPVILNDILHFMTIHLKNHESDKVTNQFGIWRNLLNSSINSAKLKLCHNSFQSMLEIVMLYIINSKTLPEFCSEYVKLQINIMENKQFPQSSNIINIYFQTSQIIITKDYNQDEFINAFDISFSIMESFMRYRKIMIVDRLPVYLAQLRIFIYQLCQKSNSNETKTRPEILKIANCAFRIEQLIKKICSLKKDVARLAPYLVADILRRYEKVTLYPEVKNHLNNSLNYLIDLCDSHAMTYLLRVLSTASREIFKNMHENYKKYYKFTGKV